MVNTPVRTFRISDDLYERLKEEANRRGVSIADVIRTAIEKELK